MNPIRPIRRFLLLFVAGIAAIVAYGENGPEKAKSSETSPHPATHSFRIRRTTESYAIDGRLKEPFWKRSDRLDGFRVDADPERIPAMGTTVRLSWDEKNFFIAFECATPAREKMSDADMCEVSIFSRPETPYYSPFLQRLDYMNAEESVRTMRRFQVTAANGRKEANVYKVGPHTSYIVDESWNCFWESAVSPSDHGYTAEISIPWTAIGGLPRPGHTFRINFIRNRSQPVPETSCFNWYSGENIRVKPFASENFIQEYPTIFAWVRFDGGQAELRRFVETDDPWRVRRTRAEFERVLTDRPVPLRSTHFYLGLSSFPASEAIRKLYDEKTWALEEANLLAEIGEAGGNGPFLPAFLKTGGEAGIEDLYKRYGMRFSLHGGADAQEAKKAGASILTPNGYAAFFDPVYIQMKQRMLEDFLNRFGRSPWLADVWGQDEPFNQIATLLQPGMYERVDREIGEAYGVTLGVPRGIPNVVYEKQPIQENSRSLPDPGTARSRIAVFRWLNRTYAEVARGEQAIVRRLAPSKPFQAFNRNAVADLDFLDQALLWDFTDIFSADPYPSFCIYVYGPARSRYHVGFTSKLVTDLAAGKPTQMIIQGCEMIQRLSTVENVREWASQAAKAGVSLLDWWGTPRLDHPAVYREMIRLSKLWKTLPALDLPKRSDIAVVFGDDARAACGDEALHAHYTLHSLLGERLGSWFTFVSENHVRRGIQNLDGKRLILVPWMGYLSRSFGLELKRRVEEGATLVLLDPDAFTWDIESGALTDLRLELLGSPLWPKRKAQRLLSTGIARNRWHADAPLPLRPLSIAAEPANARALVLPAAARVLFTYEDGTPAAYARKLGKGEMIVFGAMPFQDSELAVAPGGWENFFSGLIDELKIPRDLPIWRFRFPEKGGEISFLSPLVTLPENSR
jgi:hypothetical protein